MPKTKKLPAAKAEPTMIRGLVVAVLTVLAGLGFTWAADVDEKTITAVVVVAGAVIPLVQALWTRYAVTPSAAVLAQVTQDGRVVAGEAAAEPTGLEVDQPRRDDHGQVVAEVAVKRDLLE